MSVLDHPFGDPFGLDFSKLDPETLKNFATLLGQGCSCGSPSKDVRPWPPDNPKAQKFCAECRMKKAIAMGKK